MGRGAQYSLKTQELSHYVLVTVKTDSLLTETTLAKVTSLAKATLKIENVQVENKIADYEPDVEEEVEEVVEEVTTEETENTVTE